MSIIAAGTTTTTALSSTGNTDGTLQFQVNGTTPSVTLNTLGAVGVGSTPGYGSSGQVLTSAGSTAAPTWTSVTSSQWTTTGSDIYYNTGNVGIGTSSPGTKLDVNGATRIRAGNTLYFQNSAADANATISAVGGSGNSDMTINSGGGNLGLGVTPSAWSGVFKAIDFSTTASLVGSSGGANLFNNAYYNGTDYIYKTTAAAARYLQSGGEHYWYRAASGTAGNAITFTQALAINSSGAIGVGSGGSYGSSGQVLTSAGSGAAPTWETVGSDYVKIATVAVSNGSTTINLPSIFSTTYKFYVIQFLNIKFVAPYTRDMYVYWTQNNGSSYPIYAADGNQLWGAGNYSATPRAVTISWLNLVQTEPMNVNYGYCGTLTVMNPAQAGASVSGFLDSTYYGNNYGPFQSRQGYTLQSAGAYTGFQITTVSPATFDSGTVYVYGIK